MIKGILSLPTRLLKVGITICLLPVLLYICAKTLNVVLTDDVMSIINNCLNGIDYVLGSRQTNIMLSLLSIAMVVSFAKWINRLINNKGEED